MANALSEMLVELCQAQWDSDKNEEFDSKYAIAVPKHVSSSIKAWQHALRESVLRSQINRFSHKRTSERNN